ncbi:MAG TPA: hypothetical protein VKU00_10760 [Chthonomonadaceae bacterium]|nr:hypothetical protein [Chthonomonadaceae bacterium]
MTAINLPQFLANKIRTAGTALHDAVAKMPDDRIGWHPVTENNTGRDALDQALECAYLNEWVAQAYRTHEMPSINWDDYKAETEKRRNKAACLAWLKSSTEALASAIESFPEQQLGAATIDPIHNGKPTTWADFAIDLFYWNTVYHEGQVNYIQVLYGDMS